MRIIFVRSHTTKLHKWKVGHIADLDIWLYEELMAAEKIKDYTGPWPPGKRKTKINLKDLR